jgi:hypothetical protein
MDTESYTEIKVKDGSSHRYAMVCPQDLPIIEDTSKNWRLSSTGYVLAVKRNNGKVETSYLHKIIAGGPAKHINGNRLDNRRSNLLLLRDDGTAADIEVMDVQETECNTSPYDEIHPVFVGDTKDGQPNGYGLLATELETHVTHEIGVWENGLLVQGMQVMYTRTCRCPGKDAASLICVNRQIISINLIK